MAEKRRYKVSLRRDVVQFAEVEVEAGGQHEASAAVRHALDTCPVSWTHHPGEAVVIGVNQTDAVQKLSAV